MDAIIEVLTALFGWMTSSATTIVSLVVSNPLLLMFVCLGFVGIGVGLIRRLIRM